MAKKAVVTVSDRTPISAKIQNRLKHPFGVTDTALPLKNPQRWQMRIFDRGFRSNRISEAAYKGWVPLEPADLDCDPEDYGWRVDAGKIVRGDRGTEILMKMPRPDWQAVEAAKTEANIKSTLGEKANKQTILERAEAELGDEGASAMHRMLNRMEIKDTLESPLERD